MPAKKFAISVPEDVMEQVDAAAKDRGLTRSAFIAAVLRRVANARSDAEVTRRVNQLFSDPEVVREQRETSDRYRRARAEGGTEW